MARARMTLQLSVNVAAPGWFSLNASAAGTSYSIAHFVTAALAWQVQVAQSERILAAASPLKRTGFSGLGVEQRQACLCGTHLVQALAEAAAAGKHVQRAECHAVIEIECLSVTPHHGR